MSNFQFQCEKVAGFVAEKYSAFGMRWNPLRGAGARLVCANGNALRRAAGDLAAAGWNVAGPFLKLDGARFVEVY